MLVAISEYFGVEVEISCIKIFFFVFFPPGIEDIVHVGSRVYLGFFGTWIV